jgi:hypothetical protein
VHIGPYTVSSTPTMNICLQSKFELWNELANFIAKFTPNFRTWQRNWQVRNELGNSVLKSYLKSTIIVLSYIWHFITGEQMLLIFWARGLLLIISPELNLPMNDLQRLFLYVFQQSTNRSKIEQFHKAIMGKWFSQQT